MKTIRRIYLYLVGFISLEVVAWAVIRLVRSMFVERGLGRSSDQLALGLAFILVGLPIFLLHWGLAQREALKDPEARSSTVRAVFLFGAWLGLGIPVVQNIIAIMERALALLFNVTTRSVAIGGSQTWTDNIIGMVVNGLLAAYIFSVIRADWQAKPRGDGFPVLRRINRYVWMLYGLVMGFAGVLQLVDFIFRYGETIGSVMPPLLVDGVTFAVVGIPIWVYAWRVIQRSLVEPKEKTSRLRMGVLYAVSFISAVASLVSFLFLLSVILRVAFGDQKLASIILSEIGDPLSVILPGSVVWLYFWGVLRGEIKDLPDTTSQAGMRRLYFYVLSFLGLTATFVGTIYLALFLLDMALPPGLVWGRSSQRALGETLSAILVGLPVWLVHWRPMMKEATAEDEAGDHARRSLVRKVYLYVALFAGVMGVMFTAGQLFYTFIEAALNGASRGFLNDVMDIAANLVLFAVFGAYHWGKLQADGKRLAKTLSGLHAQFPVAVFDPGEGAFAKEMEDALNDICPDVPAAVHFVGDPFDKTLKNAGAAVLSASLATAPPEAIRLWLEDFGGVRLVVPDDTADWVWIGVGGDSSEALAKQAAKIVSRLAEEQDVSRARTMSAVTVVGYVVGGVVGIGLLCAVINLMAEFLRW